MESNANKDFLFLLDKILRNRHVQVAHYVESAETQCLSFHFDMHSAVPSSYPNEQHEISERKSLTYHILCVDIGASFDENLNTFEMITSCS